MDNCIIDRNTFSHHETNQSNKQHCMINHRRWGGFQGEIAVQEQELRQLPAKKKRTLHQLCGTFPNLLEALCMKKKASHSTTRRVAFLAYIGLSSCTRMV